MLPLYTYAFLSPSSPSSSPLCLPDGIAGSVQLVGIDRLMALVEPELSLETLQANDQQLLQAVIDHDRVLCALFQQTPVLPLRFGTCFASQPDLLHHLEIHQQSYLETLAKLVGKGEYAIKLIPTALPEPLIAAEITGKNYFLAKKQQYQAQMRQQTQQREELQTLLLAIAQSYPQFLQAQPQSGIEKLYLFVDQTEEASLHQNFLHWQQSLRYWEIVLSGAAPPYHFVGAFV